ncbi:hypothetical protein [Dokdonella koreensis]|uniref:Response receiver domain-containing protein n=1 Tax=Dokdonella koreensis DS-123 TaxID=1300342 RepID=A0A167H3Z6_9GAMM|nr:hypothetical protein [Dokdonella koreensis]ANB18796.1 Hypothetical protein I596_2802 [Dokdonella koreensis DS-123]
MSEIDQGLFKGVAVVIDDQAEDGSDEQITEIIAAIRAAGGHPIIHTTLPPLRADLENYTGVAFVIMDWHLFPSETPLNESLREQFYEANVDFIRRLGTYRHTPVVIFTNEDLETVEGHLKRHDDMGGYLASGRLLLKNKRDVGAKVYHVLNEWAKNVPSVLTLKTWERESIRALNELFIDLHDRSPHWPVMLWETYTDDGPSAADDLGRLITRLVASRMDTLKLDLDSFVSEIEAKHTADPSGYEKILKRVLEGERVLEEKRLHANSIAPGDFFRRPDDNGLYINVRPECDVVIRKNGVAPNLYLLRGKKIADSRITIGKYGQIMDRDPQYTVFAMFDGDAYCFEFKELQVGGWEEWKPHRKGRLLPPFSTRLQEKYTSYLQRTGLPTVPKILRPAATDASASPAQATAVASPASGDVAQSL